MKRQWENEELIDNWMLSAWDLAQLGNKIGATRLGFAVLLKFFQRQGRFPSFKNEVAAQVGVVPEAYLQYDWKGRTIKDHRAEIRELLGFRESTVVDAEQMQQWLLVEVLPQEQQEERLREQAYQWFRRLHLEVPTPDRLARLIRSAAHTFEQQLYEATLARLPETSQAALEALLLTEEQNGWEEGQASSPKTSKTYKPRARRYSSKYVRTLGGSDWPPCWKRWRSCGAFGNFNCRKTCFLVLHARS